MTKMHSLPLAGVVLATALGGAVTTAHAVPASCVSGIALDSFTTCIIGDKQFTKVTEDVPASATLEFLVFGDTYIFNINDINASSPAAFSFTYTVAVLDPFKDIVSVSVDSNVQPQPPQVTGGTTVSKDLYDAADVFLGTITSLDGGTDTITGLSEQFLKVVESFTVVGGQTLLSASNAYVQVVPEPATLSLLGLGLMAIGYAGRRRRSI